MAHYDYMPDGGCGSSRCNNGWYYWNGSEYPCSACEKIRRRQREEAEEVAEDEMSDAEYEALLESEREGREMSRYVGGGWA